jgi:hypothetical protein
MPQRTRELAIEYQFHDAEVLEWKVITSRLHWTESNVPLLLGVDGYRRMLKALSIGLLILVPLATFLLINLTRK